MPGIKKLNFYTPAKRKEEREHTEEPSGSSARVGGSTDLSVD